MPRFNTHKILGRFAAALAAAAGIQPPALTVIGSPSWRPFWVTVTVAR